MSDKLARGDDDAGVIRCNTCKRELVLTRVGGRCPYCKARGRYPGKAEKV